MANTQNAQYVKSNVHISLIKVIVRYKPSLIVEMEISKCGDIWNEHERCLYRFWSFSCLGVLENSRPQFRLLTAQPPCQLPKQLQTVWPWLVHAVCETVLIFLPRVMVMKLVFNTLRIFSNNCQLYYIVVNIYNIVDMHI